MRELHVAPLSISKLKFMTKIRQLIGKHLSNEVKKYTSLLSMICWQFGQARVGLLFQWIIVGSNLHDALLIFVAILLLSTNHDGLHILHKIINSRSK